MIIFLLLLFSFFLFSLCVSFRWRQNKKLSRFIWLFKNLLCGVYFFLLEFTIHEWIRWSDKMKWLCIYETVWPEFLMKKKIVCEEVKRFVMLLQFSNEHKKQEFQFYTLNNGTIFIFSPPVWMPCCFVKFFKWSSHKCLISGRAEMRGNIFGKV